MALLATLPDPNNKIDNYGEANPSGRVGPGFSSVQVVSTQPISSSKSRTGINFRTINTYHQWSVNIGYNKLIKSQFNAVYNFLLEKQTTLDSFYVELPQYGKSIADQDIAVGTYPAGSNTLSLTSNTGLEPGDMFSIVDTNDLTHLKTYKVTRLIGSDQIAVSPVLQRPIVVTSKGTAQAEFLTPRMRVVMSGDTLTYSLDTEGLYQLSLKLEESLT